LPAKRQVAGEPAAAPTPTDAPASPTGAVAIPVIVGEEATTPATPNPTVTNAATAADTETAEATATAPAASTPPSASPPPSATHAAHRVVTGARAIVHQATTDAQLLPQPVHRCLTVASPVI